MLVKPLASAGGFYFVMHHVKQALVRPDESASSMSASNCAMPDE
jgi:hypothetical protein